MSACLWSETYAYLRFSTTKGFVEFYFLINTYDIYVPLSINRGYPYKSIALKGSHRVWTTNGIFIPVEMQECPFTGLNIWSENAALGIYGA